MAVSRASYRKEALRGFLAWMTDLEGSVASPMDGCDWSVIWSSLRLSASMFARDSICGYVGSAARWNS